MKIFIYINIYIIYFIYKINCIQLNNNKSLINNRIFIKRYFRLINKNFNDNYKIGGIDIRKSTKSWASLIGLKKFKDLKTYYNVSNELLLEYAVMAIIYESELGYQVEIEKIIEFIIRMFLVILTFLLNLIFAFVLFTQHYRPPKVVETTDQIDSRGGECKGQTKIILQHPPGTQGHRLPPTMVTVGKGEGGRQDIYLSFPPKPTPTADETLDNRDGITFTDYYAGKPFFDLRYSRKPSTMKNLQNKRSTPYSFAKKDSNDIIVAIDKNRRNSKR